MFRFQVISCRSQKVMKLCSWQVLNLSLFRAKTILHSMWYNKSRMKTRYERIWVCGAVVEEASRKGRVMTLREKMWDLRLDDGDGWVGGWWGPSHKKDFFLFILAFLTHPCFLFLIDKQVRATRSPPPRNVVSRCGWRHDPHLEMQFQVRAFTRS
jgi:hypothetical protein